MLSRFSSRVQASPGVGSYFQQMHCPGATWKDLETHMCSEVAPRQFVNSTEKGCHGEKSDFREDMVQGWQEAQFLQLLPEACEPPLTHKQHLPWLLAPARLMVGLSLCTTVLSALWVEKKIRHNLPTAFHLLGQQFTTIINYQG